MVPPGARPSRITSHPTPYHRNVTTACYQVSARPSRLVRRLRACEGVLLCGWTRWRVTPYAIRGVECGPLLHPGPTTWTCSSPTLGLFNAPQVIVLGADSHSPAVGIGNGWCVWEIGRAMPVDSPIAQRVVEAATCMRALRRQWTYRTVAGWAPSAGSHSHEYPQLGFAPRRLFPQRPLRVAPCSSRNHAHPTGTGLSGTGEASTAARAGRCVGGRARRVHHSLCRG